jgi:hypothetical protein
MEKVTEVELKLDGYYLHPEAKKTICHIKSTTQTPCKGKLVPLISGNTYILFCERHAQVIDGFGWTRYPWTK